MRFFKFPILYLPLTLGLTALMLFLKPHVSPAQTIPNTVRLSLIPESPTILKGEEISVGIYAHPEGKSITALELAIQFDPTQFEPASPHPVVPGLHLLEILPNCSVDESCPATSSATASNAKVFLSIPCSESGCTPPPKDTSFLAGILNLRAISDIAAQSEISFVLASNEIGTQVAALESSQDVLGSTSSSTISITSCLLSHDFNSDTRVDISDIMQVASKWNSQAGFSEYDGQHDLDRDGDIDIVDIQTSANSWNQTCTP